MYYSLKKVRPPIKTEKSCFYQLGRTKPRTLNVLQHSPFLIAKLAIND